MGNMSHCRFQNTVSDLQDCDDALAESDVAELSDAEFAAAKRLWRLCERFTHDWADTLDMTK